MANGKDKEEKTERAEYLQRIADDIATLVCKFLPPKRDESYDYYFRDRTWALGVRTSAVRTYEISLTVLSAAGCAATALYMVAYGFDTLAFISCAVFAFGLALIVGGHLLTDVGYSVYIKSLDAERKYRYTSASPAEVLADGGDELIAKLKAARAKIKRLENRRGLLTYLISTVNVAALAYWATGVVLALASLSAVTRPPM